jgi:hypothetical protein
VTEVAATRSPLAAPAAPRRTRAGDPLTVRADALGELLGLSRTRVSPDALVEPGELLARIGERRRLSLDHTVVALAGATGSGKSSLFNMLAGRNLSTAGVRRPTTARPISCTWHTAHAVSPPTTATRGGDAWTGRSSPRAPASRAVQSVTPPRPVKGPGAPRSRASTGWC